MANGMDLASGLHVGEQDEIGWFELTLDGESRWVPDTAYHMLGPEGAWRCWSPTDNARHARALDAHLRMTGPVVSADDIRPALVSL